MEKLADISAFESLAGNSAAVFNSSWDYVPATIGSIYRHCGKILRLADVIRSQLVGDGGGEKRSNDLYLYQMSPAKVLMVEEAAKKLFALAEQLHEDAVGAADASERKHYRNKIVEKYPDIDLSDISSAFLDAMAEGEDVRKEAKKYVSWGLGDAWRKEATPSQRAWLDYYTKLDSI